MLIIKPDVKWTRFMHLMKSYDQRLKYVRERIGLDLAEAFLEKIKSKAPDGNEYKTYLDSLAVVELKAGPKRVVFAIISEQSKVKLGELDIAQGGGKVVVYFSAVQIDDVSEIVELLVEGNPWPLDMVPNGVPKKEVSLIHKTVTEGEVDWARQRTVDIIARYKNVFRRGGIRWGEVSKPEEASSELKSMPDFMAMAVRAEFGINADLKPHWRPAARWVLDNAVSIIHKDDKIKAALRNYLFREHTLHKGSGYETMGEKKFKKKAGEFQRRVTKF